MPVARNGHQRDLGTAEELFARFRGRHGLLGLRRCAVDRIGRARCESDRRRGELEEGDSSTVLHDTIVKFAERGVVGLVYRFGRLLWNEVGEGVVVLREEFSRRRGRRGRRRMR